MSDGLVRVRTDGGDVWIHHNVSEQRAKALKADVLDEPTHRGGRPIGERRYSKQSERPAKPKTTPDQKAEGKKAASSAETAKEKA